MLNEKLIGRQTFDLQSDRILLKEIIKKEFLGIEIWAINDDNPNNNFSHFVPEYYSKSMPSFINKPILGYFAQGDFKAHEGSNAKDTEMDITYWDNKEQILGFIRDNKDTVEVREKEGKKWIVTTAVLWSNYNYHQIKKIIKDKRKKISVEINVIDAYFTDLDGKELNAIELKNDHTLIVKDEEGKEVKYKYGTYIEHITQFDLSGITILGSKMGVPIKEGIEGASLSLLDEMGKAVFSRQQQALSFAYQKLDGEDESVEANKNFSKEDKGEMDNQDLTAQVQETSSQEAIVSTVENAENNPAPNISEDETKKFAEEGNDGQEQKNQEQENSEADGHSENCAEGDGCEGCDENCKNSAEEGADDNDDDDNDDDDDENHDENNAQQDLPNDSNCNNAENGNSDPATEDENNCKNCKFDEGEGTNDDHSADGQTGFSEEDYNVLLSKYDETKAALEASQEALAAQEKKFAETEEELAKIKEDCDNYLEVNKKYEAELTELRKTVFAMTAEKRSEEALELMSQNGLTEEQRADFLKKCQDGKYNDSYDDLKKDIALAYFDFNNGSSVKRNTEEDFSVSITPTSTPVKTAKTRKERLAEYANVD